MFRVTVAVIRPDPQQVVFVLRDFIQLRSYIRQHHRGQLRHDAITAKYHGVSASLCQLFYHLALYADDLHIPQVLSPVNAQLNSGSVRVFADVNVLDDAGATAVLKTIAGHVVVHIFRVALFAALPGLSEQHRESVLFAAANRTRQIKQVVDAVFLEFRHGQLVNVLVCLVRAGRVQREYVRIPLNVIRQRGRTVPKNTLVHRQKAAIPGICARIVEHGHFLAAHRARTHAAAAFQQSFTLLRGKIDRASVHLYGRQRDRIVPLRPHSRGQQTQRHDQHQQQAQYLFHTRFLLISVSLMDTCFRHA